MLYIAMASHSLKGTFDKSGPQNQWWRHCDVFLNQSQQNFVFLFVIPRGISVQNLSKIGQETKKLQKMGNDVISKIAQQFLCVSIFYSYLLMYQVLSWLKVR